ncbi:putative toxin-antitoxin system toxin component, PIN family [Paenarthrobacter sp. RAF54_2]|uniref:PIN domain-containing protein n=1 Tax=Paenarthrobacter sp. RAF54_2 TaxID=3233061 RepID=UPI003F9CA2AF
MFTALLDSCVLWPSTQRDFLLSLAFEGAYRFIFSEAILAEVEANEEIKRVERGDSEEEGRKKAAHLVGRMRSSFGDAIVMQWEGLEGTYSLPDPDDEHVLAAAVVGGAGSIVTENFRDFPEEKLPGGIQIVSAKEFAFDTVSMRPDLGLCAVWTMSVRSGRKGTACSPEEILDTLNKLYGMDAATELIRDLL